MNSMKAVWRNNKNGYFFVFALDNPDSFDEAFTEILELKKDSLYHHIPIILIGNKTDLEYQRKIDKKKVQKAAAKEGIKYFEISAKTSQKDSIDRLISEMVDLN